MSASGTAPRLTLRSVTVKCEKFAGAIVPTMLTGAGSRMIFISDEDVSGSDTWASTGIAANTMDATSTAHGSTRSLWRI